MYILVQYSTVFTEPILDDVQNYVDQGGESINLSVKKVSVSVFRMFKILYYTERSLKRTLHLYSYLYISKQRYICKPYKPSL